MKLYEKIGIDLNTVEGLAKLLDIDVTKWNCYKTCEYDYCQLLCQAGRLLAEVPKKKRWETYESDFVKAVNDYHNEYHNYGYGAETIFAHWLMEDVEVEE